MRTNKVLIIIGFILFSFLQLCHSECPAIQSSQRIQRSIEIYDVKGFLQIPQTNILLINTASRSVGSSLVYYNDLSATVGDTLSVVKTDYQIFEMVYATQLGLILIMNSSKILLANPYTLVAQNELQIQRSQSLRLVQNTMYAIVTMLYNVINIIDITTMKIVKILSNLNYPNTLNMLQFYSEIYTLSNGTQIIMCTNSFGVFSWSVSFGSEEISFEYNDYIAEVEIPNQNRYLIFEKHPTEDIFFFNEISRKILVYKIHNISQKNYNVIYNKRIIGELVNPQINYYTDNQFSMIYREPDVDGVKTPMLIINESKYYYKLPFVVSENTISFPTIESEKIIKKGTCETYKLYYKLEGNQQFLFSCYDYASRIDLAKEDTVVSYLDFLSDGYSKRSMYSGLQEELFIIPYSTEIYYSWKSNTRSYFKNERPNFSKPISTIKNSVSRVKLCNECLFLRLGDSSMDIAATVPIYPFESIPIEINITEKLFGLKWENINVNLDPFYLEGSTWVVLSFPYKTYKPEDYLCLLFNASTGDYVKLIGDLIDTSWVGASTAFALISVENLSNQEIIAIDKSGKIYTWDLLTNEYKSTSQLYSCTSPEIGSIFHYQQRKWLLAACEDFVVRIYDFETGSTTQLYGMTINSMPATLNAYSDPGILVISDSNIGDVHIYKFNTEDYSFLFSFTVSKGKIKDTIIGIELIQSNRTLWIQYSFSNLFYELGECIDDIHKCLICTQSTYFKTTESVNSDQLYGQGTALSPFTGSNSYITNILRIQMYKDLIPDTNKIELIVYVDPTYSFALRQELLNHDFNNIISLKIISIVQETNTSIQLNVSDTLTFKNYLTVSLINSKFDFQKTDTYTDCGLKFISIPYGAILKKIEITQSDCLRIVAYSTSLVIVDLVIENRDFTESGTIIQMYDTHSLEITNLLFHNVILGRKSSIVDSSPFLALILTNTNITNCLCTSQDVQSNLQLTMSIPLFTAGHIQVYGLSVQDNMFCKKNIFTAPSTLRYFYNNFSLFDIIMRNNQFQTISESIFFAFEYKERIQAENQVIFRQVIFENNQIFKIYLGDLELAHLVILNRVEYIVFEAVSVLNQDGISLFWSENSIRIQLINVIIENDKETRDKTPNGRTQSCLIMQEFQEIAISGLKISYKKAIDSPLIIAQNNKLSDSLLFFSIFQSSFSNLILIQNKNNVNASPIMIQSPYQLYISFLEITFEDNTLYGLKNSFIYSTSAIWITNYVGTIEIMNCIFQRSSSNSLYNYIYIASNYVYIYDSVFSEQSFDLIDISTNVNGGFINLSAINVFIIGCTFEKSFAEIGAFIMINSFGSDLNIELTRSSFKEGYALSDGGAIYINTQNSILTMICTELVFKDIYTFNDNASIFAFSQTIINFIHQKLILFVDYFNSPQQKDPTRYHTLTFEGGSLQNWFGTRDNQFIKIQGMNFTMKNVQNITYNKFHSDSQEKKFLFLNKFSQGSIISAKSSLVNVSFCQIHNLDYNVDFSVVALLVQANNSTVTIADFEITSSIFNRAAIDVTNGNLIISRSNFKNLTSSPKVFQFGRSLKLSELDVINLTAEPTTVESSLIVLHNSTLITNETTIFSEITCAFDCNGSTFQFLNSSFYIADTQIRKSYSMFGGAIYVDSMKGDSSIINSIIEQNSAKFNGGAIYFQATSSNKFKFTISSTQFLRNTATLGRGGGIYVRSEETSTQVRSIDIIGCQILFNIAQVGASIDIQNIAFTIDASTEIRDNKAHLFGSDLITFPTHLKVRNLDQFMQQANATSVSSEDVSDSDVDMVINGYQSGASFPNLEFAFVSDSEEEIVPISSEELLNYSISVKYSSNTSNKQSYSIRGTNPAYFNTTGFCFTDLQLVGIPNSSVVLEFSSKQIFFFNVAINKYVNSYTFRVRVNFRNCIPGEEANSYSEFTECSTCAKAFFSFDLKPCQNCPNGAECLGGAQMITKAGYWRKEVYSEDVILCQNLENNCVGGNFGNMICYEGHIGALCEECDIYGEYWDGNYAKSGKYSCVNCNDIKLNMLFVALLTCWTLISMTLAIKGGIEYLEHQAAAEILFSTPKSVKNEKSAPLKSSIRITIGDPKSLQNKSNAQNEQFKQPIQVNQIKEQEDKSGIYIKMLTNFFQIVSSIATFNLSIPSGIIDLPSSVGEPLHQTMNSLDCALKDIERTVPIIYLRLMFSQIIPCFYMIIFVLGLSIKYFLMKKKGMFPIYIISTGFIFLVIFMQPDLVAQTIALISCREIGGTKYILSNVAFECFTDDYNLYTTTLVVPLLLLWVLILPGILFSMLRKNKDNLSSFQVKLSYGFLYREYKLTVPYWEFVKMAEKIAIILALNFYSQSIVTKGILVFIVITVYGVTALVKQPYEEDDINQIDVQSTNICAITVLLGIFIYKNDFDYFVYTAIAVIILINVWYLFSMIKKIVRIFLQKFNEPISKVLQILAKRWPFFEKFIEKVPQKRIPNKKVLQRMQGIVRKFIRLELKSKKELIHKLFLEELDLKYQEIVDPEGKQEEENLLKKEQIEIELSSNLQKVLQNNNKQTEDDHIEINKSPLIMPSSSSLVFGLELTPQVQNNLIPSSSKIKIKETNNKYFNEKETQQILNESHSNIQIQRKKSLILFDNESNYEIEAQN